MFAAQEHDADFTEHGAVQIEKGAQQIFLADEFEALRQAGTRHIGVIQHQETGNPQESNQPKVGLTNAAGRCAEPLSMKRFRTALTGRSLGALRRGAMKIVIGVS